MNQEQKFCTHCGKGLVDRHGRPAVQLYDEELYKKSKILKLMGCAGCKKPIADKYIECDGTLLLIDLILQSKEAYRHVLLNGTYASLILRIALLTIICDGYICWVVLSESGEFFEQEHQFYMMCCKVVLAVFLFVSFVLLQSVMIAKERITKVRVTTMILGLLLAYSGRFFSLVAFLWSTFSKTDIASLELMWVCVYALFYISSIRVYQVIQESNWVESIIILTCGHAVFVCVYNVEYLIHMITRPS